MSVTLVRSTGVEWVYGGERVVLQIFFKKQLFDNVKSPIFCWLIYHLKDIYS